MKKFLCLCFSTICLAACLLYPAAGKCMTHATSSAFPRISFNRVAIGGIQPFASKDYVRSIYGEPDKIHDLSKSPVPGDGNPDEAWEYGDSFRILFAKEYVFSIVSSGHNGLKTPDGIQVGDSEAKVMTAYGQKWKLGYYYVSDWDTFFTISVQNGRVKQIYAGWNL